jgi:PncC family amidohydrolase
LSVAEELGSLLRAKGRTIAAAESCTGGKVGDMITSVPGSSDYFVGGIVSYSNDIKVGLLDVDPEVLRSEGAVSEAVARQMADGVRDRLGADVGVSTTGIAGPGGGSLAKPVGLVFVAASIQGKTLSRRYQFAGARDDVKRSSAEAVLSLAVELLADGE